VNGQPPSRSEVEPAIESACAKLLVLRAELRRVEKAQGAVEGTDATALTGELDQLRDALQDVRSRMLEIGRASCRERV